MSEFSARQQAFNSRLLDRFYGIFVLVCVVFLTIGVPFVFVRKSVSAAATLVTLAGVLLAWRMSRRGQPQKSLRLFAVGLWTVLVALLYAGLPPVTGSTALAMAVMLAMVVNLRAGVIFGMTYLMAWLLYIALVAAKVAPPAYFTGATLTGWFVAAVATWLVLLPIPEMIRNLRQAASLQAAVIEASSDGILVVNSQGQVETYNQRFVTMWGIPLVTLQSRDDSDLLNFVMQQLHDPKSFVQQVRELYASPEQSSLDRLRFKDGRVFERRSQPQRLGQQIVGRVWSFRDVTEDERKEATLVARTARLTSLMAAMQDTVLVLDSEYRVVEFFPAPGTGHRAFLARDGLVVGKSCGELMPEATAHRFADAIDALQAGGPAQNFDFNISDTQTTHCYVATLSLMAEDSGIFTVLRDVTARRAASREIERLGQRNALLLESVGEGIFDVDQQGRTTFANPAALAMLGLTQAQILGQNQHTLFHHHRADGSCYPADDCPIHQTLHDGQRRQLDSEWFWRTDGRGFPVSMVVTPIEVDGKQAGVVVLFQDITERKRSEEEIHRLAFHDALTLLPNRRLLIDRLGQMLASSKRSGMFGAVLFLDLDNFKPLNDAQGHAVGDMLLVEVARRLNLAVREMDTVARFGGDEFVVMLGKLDTDPVAARMQAGAVAEKIRRALAQPYELIVQQDDGTAVHVRHNCTASIGLCLFPQDETNADEVLKAADAAMYRAKDAGRDAVRFHGVAPRQ